MSLTAPILDEVAQSVGSRWGWPDGGAQGLRAWLGLPDPQRPSEPHDLVSADHDLPSRRAVRSVVIASDYRSGSTVLAEGLTGAGGYGIPVEYFQAGAMERKFVRFADTSPDGYLRHVMTRRTSASGVFGTKVFWPESPIIERLPDPVIISLSREDVAAQAVSTWTALTTNIWRSSRSQRSGDAPYDRRRLVALAGMHAHHAACWRRALAGVPVIDVTYEELSRDPVATMESIVAALGDRGMPAEGSVPQPRLARQASQHSQQLASRLTDDILERRWE